MIEYKDTLNILKTNFEMRANLNKKEPLIQKKWQEDKIYYKALEKNKNNKPWILHDGPPYANGDIHLGHALNKIIKDIIVRYHLMNGHYSPFIPGWDTHGLPIEHALLKKGQNKDPNLTITQKWNNCAKFAIENVKKQMAQFSRLGLACNLEDNYLTLYPWFEINHLNLFLAMVKKGLVFQDFKPVYWSWSSHSALAEAEIEYKDLEAYSIFFSCLVTKGNKLLDKNDKLLVWTTTPWTIPSNLAIAVHPDFEYIKVKYHNQNYVLLKSLADKITKALNWDKYDVIAQFKGKDIENVEYQHPWIKRIGKIILAEYVTNEDGTGLVHNAPGFGLEDYYACKKYNINIYCPIDANGKFDQSINDPQLEGLFYEKANEIVLERLKNNNLLESCNKITHSAAVDWRTKKPVIYRATKQWFINIEKIRKELLAAVESVSFTNINNKKQLISMISNRKEWCISRQRIWGVPIPIIFDENKQPIFDLELIENILSLLAQNGTNIWFEKDVKFFLTKKYLENKNHSKFAKEQDIMDVWFDSGSSYNVLRYNNLPIPSDLYFEGNDQYRGWFNSSLICSVIQENKAPYKHLLSHGFVLDEQGRKMSKSLGNVVDPLQTCNELGADILRLWVASTNFQEDVKVSKSILSQISEIYRRIRNTIFKFILANISDYTYDSSKTYEFDAADEYIIYELKQNLAKIIKAYEIYDYASIIKIINLHAINLSSWYFDVIKDCLYCDQKDNKHRLAIQTVLYTILKTYLIVLAPIIPHTCEEAYQASNFPNKKRSILLEDFITKIDLKIKQPNVKYFESFFKLKNEVFLVLESLRAKNEINKNTQAAVKIELNNIYNFDEKTLKNYLNVAKVNIINNIKLDDNKLIINASNANMVRCDRCWNYFNANEINSQHICKRCEEILNKSIKGQ